MKASKDLLARYREGAYSQKDLETIENMISAGTISLEELEDVIEVNQAMSHELSSASESRMDMQVYQSIQTHSNQAPKIKYSKWILFLSALVVILAASCFYLVGKLSAKKDVPQEMSPQHFASSLLNQEQVEDKIHLITNVTGEQVLDDTILDALLFNLISDKSTNVRLASLNVLRQYVASPFIRQGLINAIPFQDSPIVLLYLKEAISLSGKTMNEEDFSERVKREIRPALDKSFNSITL